MKQRNKFSLKERKLNERKQRWSNRARIVQYFIRIQYFEMLHLSSSGCYELWLSETGTLQPK